MGKMNSYSRSLTAMVVSVSEGALTHLSSGQCFSFAQRLNDKKLQSIDTRMMPLAFAVIACCMPLAV